MIIEAAFTAWRYRIPGQERLINWPEFITVLLETGFRGGTAMEHEDDFSDGDDDPKPPEFSPDRKDGFLLAQRFLRCYLPGRPARRAPFSAAS